MFTDRSAQIEWLASLFPAVAPAQGAVTVMFTDIAGFTAFAASRGERATMGLLLQLRIGVHTGVARWREGDLVGHDVNLASRIADRATGGQILVSEPVRAAAKGVPARFRRARPLAVPGPEPTVLFRVER